MLLLRQLALLEASHAAVATRLHVVVVRVAIVRPYSLLWFLYARFNFLCLDCGPLLAYVHTLGRYTTGFLVHPSFEL